MWFRVAAFPDFRKLFGRLNGGLPAGNYSLNVLYSILSNIMCCQLVGSTGGVNWWGQLVGSTGRGSTGRVNW